MSIPVQEPLIKIHAPQDLCIGIPTLYHHMEVKNCFPLFRTVGSKQDSDEGEEAISPVVGTCCDAGQALIPGLVPLTDVPVTLILSHV